jgi:hypothetical protein
VLAGVGPACCALAGPRRNLRFVKSEWPRRRGLSLLNPGDAAGFSVVCTNRPLAASSTSHAVSGQRAACERRFAHPTMESPQKSLAHDKPEYLGITGRWVDIIYFKDEANIAHSWPNIGKLPRTAACLEKGCCPEIPRERRWILEPTASRFSSDLP